MTRRNGKFTFLGALTLGLVPLCLSLQAAEVPPTQETKKDPAAHKDLHQDPLPKDALARLGTLRWRQGSPVAFLAILPDNKTLLSVGQDQLVRLWDASTGRQLRQFSSVINRPGQTTFIDSGGVNLQGASLSPDGKLLALVGNDMRIRVLEIATGKEFKQLTGTMNGVTGLVFTPDSKSLASTSYDGSIHLWDLAQGKVARSWNTPTDQNRIFYGGMNGMSFSHDAKRLVTIGTELDNQQAIPTLKIWDVAGGKLLHKIRNPQGAYGFYSPTFSPDNKLVAWATGDGNIHLHDPTSGKEVRVCQPTQRRGGMTQILFSPDGKKLLSRTTVDTYFREFSVASGKELRQIGPAPQGVNQRIYYGYYGNSMTVAMSPDGKLLAGVAGPNVIQMIDVATGKEIVGVPGHDSAILAVRYSADGKTVTTQSIDGSIHRWERATGKDLGKAPLPGGILPYYSTVLSDDGSLLASASYDGTATIYDTVKGKQLHRVTVGNNQRGGSMRLAFSPDGKILAARPQMDSTIHLFSMTDGKEMRKLLPQGEVLQPPPPGVGISFNPAQSMVLDFSPDGKHLVASNPADNSLRVFEINLGREIRQIPFSRNQYATSTAFSPDSRTLALEMNDGSTSVWEVATGKQRRLFGSGGGPATPGNTYARISYYPYGQQNGITTLVFSPDGQMLARAGLDRKTHLWEVATGKDLGLFEGHDGALTTLAFAPDGKALITGSADTTALVWDVKAREQKRTPRTGALKDTELEAHWNELNGSDAIKAGAALGALYISPKQVVPFLQTRLKPAEEAPTNVIEKLIVDLDNNRYLVRKKALDELERMGDLASPVLREALKQHPSMEVRKRLVELLDNAATRSFSGEQLRALRAIELLEQLGTPEAKAVLQTLAKGAPSALVTTEAQAALSRLGK